MFYRFRFLSLPRVQISSSLRQDTPHIDPYPVLSSVITLGTSSIALSVGEDSAPGDDKMYLCSDKAVNDPNCFRICYLLTLTCQKNYRNVLIKKAVFRIF